MKEDDDEETNWVVFFYMRWEMRRRDKREMRKREEEKLIAKKSKLGIRVSEILLQKLLKISQNSSTTNSCFASTDQQRVERDNNRIEKLKLSQNVVIINITPTHKLFSMFFWSNSQTSSTWNYDNERSKNKNIWSTECGFNFNRWTLRIQFFFSSHFFTLIHFHSLVRFHRGFAWIFCLS